MDPAIQSEYNRKETPTGNLSQINHNEETKAAEDAGEQLANKSSAAEESKAEHVPDHGVKRSSETAGPALKKVKSDSKASANDACKDQKQQEAHPAGALTSGSQAAAVGPNDSHTSSTNSFYNIQTQFAHQYPFFQQRPPPNQPPHPSFPTPNIQRVPEASSVFYKGAVDNPQDQQAPFNAAQLPATGTCTSEQSGKPPGKHKSKSIDIKEKLKEMGEITFETVKKLEKKKANVEAESETATGKKAEEESPSMERKGNLNLRRNIREVMDETKLDESTLAAQRQEMERLRRVQEQQRVLRDIQRQANQDRVISLLQGHDDGQEGTSTTRIGNTVLVKLSNGQVKASAKYIRKPIELTRVPKHDVPASFISHANITPSVSIAPVPKRAALPYSESESDESDGFDEAQSKHPPQPVDVIDISSDDDDCIVVSETEDAEEDEDPTNSGMHTNDEFNQPDEQGRVVINTGHPEDESDIYVAPQIARIIKPHQIGGIRFLYDNIIESTLRYDTSTGFGCILAHSMGLGKTLQVVCFSDIFLRHTSSRTILCIMPINTLQNWMAEYNMWLPTEESVPNSPLLVHGEVRPRNFNLHVLNDSHKTLAARAKVIHNWYTSGGVLLIGYEQYRLLSQRRFPKSRSKKAQVRGNPDDGRNKALFDEVHEALVTPGPDLVICDEGHRIKNSHASISQALKQMRTKRRVVLTGYPLQNNLMEYWCMVDFARPNYLGTKTEFCNMFERPIQNGQCIDSTETDIKLMRYRAHVLHSLLLGFVQRRSHRVLQTALPQKEEYVLLVRMTPFQRTLYETFMNDVVRSQTVPNPLKAFAVCCKIWNHPDVLYHYLKKHKAGAVDIDLEEVASVTSSVKTAKPRVRKQNKKGKPAASVTPYKTDASAGETAAAATKPSPVSSPVPIPPPKDADTFNSPPSNASSQNSSNNHSGPNDNYNNFNSTPPGYNSQNEMQNFGGNFNQPPPTSHSGSAPTYPGSNQYMNAHNSCYPGQSNFSIGTSNAYPHYNFANGNYNLPTSNPSNYPPQGHYNAQPNYQSGYANQANAGFASRTSSSRVGNSPQMPPGQNNAQQYGNYPQNNYPQQTYLGGTYPNQNYWPNQHQAESQNAQVPEVKTGPSYYDYNNYKDEFDDKNFAQGCHPWAKQEDVKPIKMEQDTKPKINILSNISIKNPYENASNASLSPEKKISVLSDFKLEPKSESEDGDSKKVDSEQSEAVIADKVEKIDLDEDTKSSSPSKGVKEDAGIPYDWAIESLKDYVPGFIENSAKMEILFSIVKESLALGDRLLVFSQSLITLDLIEQFLQMNFVPGDAQKWAKNNTYYRLDGSTSALEREKLINEFNSNPKVYLFLVSTRAGSLGINLIGANRVVVLDASWNPCHDTQAVCRVYRYGQRKPCFVYRLVVDNCLEKKIYDRQINKQGMSDRVVDECNPDAHLTMKDVTTLCWDDEKETEEKDWSHCKDKYIDVVLQKVLEKHGKRFNKEPFQHESLLIDRKDKQLSSLEKRMAKRGYEREKLAIRQPNYNLAGGHVAPRQRPVASVRPMQQGGEPGRPSKWIPAEHWQRQGMTAQEMTLPLDVVIPTNQPEKGNIVLKAGQKVLVLKSPKGVYMQLESGKIVAIKTAIKVRGKNEEDGSKVKPLPAAQFTTAPLNLPPAIKNNSAITLTAPPKRAVKPFVPTPKMVIRGRSPMAAAGVPRTNKKVQISKDVSVMEEQTISSGEDERPEETRLSTTPVRNQTKPNISVKANNPPTNARNSAPRVERKAPTATNKQQPSTLQQLEKTTTAMISETKKPFQETLNSITSSYQEADHREVSAPSQPITIDDDGEAKPSTPNTLPQLPPPQDAHAASLGIQMSKPSSIPSGSEYAYGNYYGYNMQTYPQPPPAQTYNYPAPVPHLSQVQAQPQSVYELNAYGQQPGLQQPLPPLSSTGIPIQQTSSQAISQPPPQPPLLHPQQQSYNYASMYPPPQSYPSAAPPQFISQPYEYSSPALPPSQSIYAPYGYPQQYPPPPLQGMYQTPSNPAAYGAEYQYAPPTDGSGPYYPPQA